MKEGELKSMLPAVIAATKTGADFIAAERTQFTYDRVEKKGLNDLVSYVDKETEKLLIQELEKILPGCGFIAEESTVEKRAEYNWIIDPLDGTTNFIHGIPSYAVSVGLEKDGEILLGVVHEVSRNECFTATRNGGAFLNGSPIRVSDRATLSEALVGTGFPIYNFGRMAEFIDALRYFMQRTHGVRRIGAAAVDLCYVACGRLDVFFEYNLSAWDVAAGALIVKEAGGTVHDFSGGSNWLFGKEIACTNGKLHEEFKNALQGIFTS